MAESRASRREENVRIGPISIITLIAVISMAVLAVLSTSTAHATKTISERQAAATHELYLNERAAQEFVAGIDDALASVAGGSATGSAAAVDRALDDICAAARAAGENQVTLTAKVEGESVTAEFVGESMRRLDVKISIRDGATYRIDKWKTAAVQQEAPTAGTLWTGE